MRLAPRGTRGPDHAASVAAEIHAYLGRSAKRRSSSVGAYQIEGPGNPAVRPIDGDYFAILGLPLLALLKWLREEGAMA